MKRYHFVLRHRADLLRNGNEALHRIPISHRSYDSLLYVFSRLVMMAGIFSYDVGLVVLIAKKTAQNVPQCYEKLTNVFEDVIRSMLYLVTDVCFNNPFWTITVSLKPRR